MPRIALAQIKPAKGDYAANLDRIGGVLRQAATAAPQIDLVVFPETVTSGYFVEGGVRQVAVTAGTLARDLAERHKAAGGTPVDVAVGFYEVFQSRLFNSCLYATLDGDAALVRHVHRKCFLPTYGLFDERRFFAAGDVLRATPSRLGPGVGLAVCEDFWHLGVPQLLALDGAQILINVSSSPGRDLAATNEVGLGTAASWRTLIRTYAQLTTSFVVFCNRVGVDESISFWGGSEVIAPSGAAVFSAPLYDEGLFVTEINAGDVRRERVALPVLRDERPELQLRELNRIVAERAGLEADSTAEPGALPGGDVAADDGKGDPIGFRSVAR